MSPLLKKAQNRSKSEDPDSDLGSNGSSAKVEYAPSLKELRRRYCQLRTDELHEDGLKYPTAAEIAREESKGILAFFDRQKGIIFAPKLGQLREKEKENSGNIPSAFNPHLRLIYGSVLRFETTRAKTQDEAQALRAQFKYLIDNGLFVRLTPDGFSIHSEEIHSQKSFPEKDLDDFIKRHISASPLLSQSVRFFGNENSNGKVGSDWASASVSYSARLHALAPQPDHERKKGLAGFKKLFALCGDIIKVGPSQEPFEVDLASVRFSHDEINSEFGHLGDIKRPSIWKLVGQLRSNSNFFLDLPPLRVVQIGENDFISLDNRRLACLIIAECPKVVVRWATKKEIDNELLWRFTSDNEGLWARIRGTETDIVVPR